jgi:drug/metabolite transporter (DMT)-like permease
VSVGATPRPFGKAALIFGILLGVFGIIGAWRGLDARSLTEITGMPAVALILPMVFYVLWTRSGRPALTVQTSKAIENDLLLVMCCSAVVLGTIPTIFRSGGISVLLAISLAILVLFLGWVLRRLAGRVAAVP